MRAHPSHTPASAHRAGAGGMRAHPHTSEREERERTLLGCGQGNPQPRNGSHSAEESVEIHTKSNFHSVTLMVKNPTIDGETQQRTGHDTGTIVGLKHDVEASNPSLLVMLTSNKQLEMTISPPKTKQLLTKTGACYTDPSNLKQGHAKHASITHMGLATLSPPPLFNFFYLTK